MYIGIDHTHSGGIIVHRKTGKIALPSKDGSLFQFPKGRREAGEPIRLTAMREIEEESGLVRVRLVKELGNYSRIKQSGQAISVLMYVGHTLENDNVKPFDPNFRCTEWFSVREALRDVLKYSQEEEFFRQQRTHLEKFIEQICLVTR